MSTPVTNLPTPLFGRDGEPCGTCRAPLAGNQRYCLYCGARRPEARLEFLEVLTTDVAVQSYGTYPAPGGYGPGGPNGPGLPAGPPPREPGANGWLKANSGVLALTGLLLGTLLVGLLIGHWATSGGDAPQTKAAAPQVIQVGGAGAAGTGAAAGAAAGAGAAAATDKAAASDAKAAKKKSSASSSSSDDAVVAVPKNSVKADQVTKLKGQAYDNAIKNAAKKGAPISSGNGKLPPKDDKPAGGGSDFEEIG